METMEIYCSCGKVHTIEFDFKMKHIALIEVKK